ncbi:MAG: hypothetical protein R2932_08285 [Caldilineaceae bacterium]
MAVVIHGLIIVVDKIIADHDPACEFRMLQINTGIEHGDHNITIACRVFPTLKCVGH